MMFVSYRVLVDIFLVTSLSLLTDVIREYLDVEAIITYQFAYLVIVGDCEKRRESPLCAINQRKSRIVVE